MSLQSKNLRLQRGMLSGFTLLEMMIVIAIMLLLVIATLPRIKYALDESKVRESSRQLNSYFSMAKSRAATTGRPCGVWMVADFIGDPNASPPLRQVTQFYLAEIPPPYSGDIRESTAYLTGNNGSDWLMNFTPAAAGLTTLVQNGDVFRIRFDHKGPFFEGYCNGGAYYIKFIPTLMPPQANGNAGYQYEIVRGPKRIGSSLSLPRGTCIDLSYSGFGNTGVDFFAVQNSGSGIFVNQAMPTVLLMFSSDGHIDSVSYQTWDIGAGQMRFVSGALPQGTCHFLVNRPEKVLSASVGVPPGSLANNIGDSNALWVSVARLTGSVTTTDNAYTDSAAQLVADQPGLNPANATFSDYLFSARKYAREQDVKGGR